VDDYFKAWVARKEDTTTLATRYEGAMHLGGITIECLLKHMAQQYLSLKHPLGGHLLGDYFYKIDPLQDRMNDDIATWIEKVQWPISTKKDEVDYIAVRYLGSQPSQADYEDWYNAYNGLQEWLKEQMGTIGRKSK
jgi:hypothetical protein